jgi:hypothetical protein
MTMARCPRGEVPAVHVRQRVAVPQPVTIPSAPGFNGTFRPRPGPPRVVAIPSLAVSSQALDAALR